MGRGTLLVPSPKAVSTGISRVSAGLTNPVPANPAQSFCRSLLSECEYASIISPVTGAIQVTAVGALADYEAGFVNDQTVISLKI